MKKISILIMLTALLCALVGCKNELPPHTHTPEVVAAIAPTCTASGLTEGTRCAECGVAIVAREVIPAIGHTPVTDAAVAATCTEEGLTEGSHCSVCGEIFTEQQRTPKAEHNIVFLEAVAPTCVTEGHSAGEGCSVCGTMLNGGQVLPTTEHTPQTIEAVAPTCAITGYTEGKECAVCGELIETPQTLDRLPHTEVTTAAKAPTCAAEGCTEGKKCTVCGQIIVAPQTLARLAHTEVTVAALDPTCTTDGHAAGTKCAVCNTVLSGMDGIEALGHIEVIDAAVDATYDAVGFTEGKHCSRCAEVLVAQQMIPMLERTNGFPKGTITTSPTTLLTNHLELYIHENIYVPGELVNSINILTSVMEKVSGMKFEGNPKYAGRYSHPSSTTKLTFVEVTKPETESELGPAYAMPSHAVVCSGDLLDLSTLVHECSHMLQSRQSTWYYCQWAMEGISTYTTYKTQDYVAKHYPDLAECMNLTFQSFVDMGLEDYNLLYEHPMEYWIDNTLEKSANANYVIGFRLMWYLDVTYGNYTKWIYALEEKYPAYENMRETDQLSKEKILEAFYLAYGESVFDDFYAWLKQNESLFEAKESTVDLRGAKRFNVYPFFYFSGNKYAMKILHFPYLDHGILYRDLYIGLEEGIRYLKEYKHKNCDTLTLSVNDGIQVKLFDKNGTLLRTVSGQNIDLTGVSYVQLVGEGKLTRFEITGYQ